MVRPSWVVWRHPRRVRETRSGNASYKRLQNCSVTGGLFNLHISEWRRLIPSARTLGSDAALSQRRSKYRFKPEYIVLGPGMSRTAIFWAICGSANSLSKKNWVDGYSESYAALVVSGMTASSFFMKRYGEGPNSSLNLRHTRRIFLGHRLFRGTFFQG